LAGTIPLTREHVVHSAQYYGVFACRIYVKLAVGARACELLSPLGARVLRVTSRCASASASIP